jgi:hypothetical protein
LDFIDSRISVRGSHIDSNSARGVRYATFCACLAPCLLDRGHTGIPRQYEGRLTIRPVPSTANLSDLATAMTTMSSTVRSERLMGMGRSETSAWFPRYI